MKILISGGTGLIGKTLTHHLEKNGHKVFIISRGRGDFFWDINRSLIDKDCLKEIDSIIHLAGAGIADKPWTKSRKKELYDSRIKSTELLYKLLSTSKHSVSSFISASAIGYYGADAGENLCEENNPPGIDYIGNLTKDWENSSLKIKALGIRTVQIRIGLVLTNNGGFLKKISPPIKLGIGSSLGSGKQWQSWIHIDDLIEIFSMSVEKSEVQGPINAVAPEPVRQEFLMQSLAKAYHRPYFFPNIPAFIIKLIFGDLAKVILGSLKVSSKKIQKLYSFKFKTIDSALKNLIS